MQLSVIIPVYNVEKYIHDCLYSIFRQGLDDSCFEVIIINDGTQDNSIKVIEDILRQHSNITIIEQKNQGLSAARNTGLAQASGEYILFVDSDDLLISESLKKLIEDAQAAKPDLLIAGFIKMTDQEIGQKKTILENRYHSRLKLGRQAFLEDLNPQQCYVWRTIYKKTFLEKNHIMFINGIYFEDVPFTTECYLKAEKCIISDYIFYIYRQRPDSIVSAINKRKLMDFHHVLASLWKMRSIKMTKDEQYKLMDIIFTTFSIEMWYISHSKELMEVKSEIIKDMKMKVPELRFTGSLKKNIVSFLYKTMPNTYLNMLSFRS